MYSTFLVLTLLTSLATASPLPSESSVIKVGLVTRDLQDLVGDEKSTAEGKQAWMDERVNSQSQGAPQIATRQLQIPNIVSFQQASDDATDQYGSGTLAESSGTPIARSVSESSETVFESVKLTAKSSVEKHARDTSEGLSPKSRTYRRSCAGALSDGRGKGATQSNELLAQGEANGAQDGSNNNGAQGGGHVANVNGQANGFAFGQAVRFPHK